MNSVFDLVEEINEKVTEYFYSTGLKPSTLEISPGSYRRLLEIDSSEHAIGNLSLVAKGCGRSRQRWASFTWYSMRLCRIQRWRWREVSLERQGSLMFRMDTFVVRLDVGCTKETTASS